MRNKKFEAWFSKWVGISEDRVSDMWNGKSYESYRFTVESAWAAWCAALCFEVSE
jgi:hypothetical protein